MCDDKNKKGDADMSIETLNCPKKRHPKILKALKEVEMIKSGKIPRKSAREFLEKSRKNK